MADTRDRLLTATNESFRRRGYNGTSLKHVTAAAQAPTGRCTTSSRAARTSSQPRSSRPRAPPIAELFVAIADDAASPASRSLTSSTAPRSAEETDFIDPCPIGTVAREVASTTSRSRRDQRVFASWIDGRRYESLAARRHRVDEAERLVGASSPRSRAASYSRRAERDAERLRETGRRRRCAALVQQAVQSAVVAAAR